MGIKMKWYIHKHLTIKSFTQVRLCKWLVQMKSTCKRLVKMKFTLGHELALDSLLIQPWLGRRSPPSFLWYTLDLVVWIILKWLFVLGLPGGSPEIPKLWVLQLCMLVPIEDLPTVKLWPLTMSFQHCGVHFH